MSKFPISHLNVNLLQVVISCYGRIGRGHFGEGFCEMSIVSVDNNVDTTVQIVFMAT